MRRASERPARGVALLRRGVIRALHVMGGAALSLAASADDLGVQPCPAVFELSSLDGTNGFVLAGERDRDVSATP